MTPSQTIKNAQDLTEKYYRINLDFPELAGKFMSVSRAQRRLLEKFRNTKQDEEVKALMVAQAELIDAGEELVKWTHAVLTEVVKDAAPLLETAKLRDQLKFANTLVSEYMNKQHYEPRRPN